MVAKSSYETSFWNHFFLGSINCSQRKSWWFRFLCKQYLNFSIKNILKWKLFLKSKHFFPFSFWLILKLKYACIRCLKSIKKGKRGTISSAKCIQNGTKNSEFHSKSTFKMHSGNSVEFQKNQNSFDMQCLFEK